MNRNIYLIGFTIGAAIIIPIIWWLVLLVSQQGTVLVKVAVAPSDSSISINNKVYVNKKEIRLTPGEYTVRVSKGGFEENSQKITINADKTNSIIALLTPTSDEAQQWVANNQTLYMEIEGEVGKIAAQQGIEFTKEYPLTIHLPIQKSIYTIGYKQLDANNPNQGILVTINAVEGYRESALQEIRDLGFDPSDYKIEFTNYRNPFNE